MATTNICDVAIDGSKHVGLCASKSVSHKQFFPRNFILTDILNRPPRKDKKIEQKLPESPRSDPLRDAPVPPYETREKPADRKTANKSNRNNMRRQAEPFVYPWNRDGVDFITARANATWDNSIYSQATLEAMRAVRLQNEPIIDSIDQLESERQRE